jgi:RNA polymerase sigma-70 factor (ECF subfamily)
LTEAESQSNRETANTAEVGETLTPELLVRKYSPAVLGFCLAKTKNIHDSEDIMQDVFLKAFKKFNTLRDHTRARAWLLKIARRVCVDYYRNSSPTQTMPNDVQASTDSQSERIRCLHKAISKLPDGYRELITLYYLDGRNCANVAECLGISEDAVRSRLVRARMRLHDLLLENQL